MTETKTGKGKSKRPNPHPPAPAPGGDHVLTHTPVEINGVLYDLVTSANGSLATFVALNVDSFSMDKPITQG